MHFSAGCLRLELERVVVTRQEFCRLSSPPGAASGNAIPDAEQRSGPRCCCPGGSHGWAQAEAQEGPRAPGWGWAPRGGGSEMGAQLQGSSLS